MFSAVAPPPPPPHPPLTNTTKGQVCNAPLLHFLKMGRVFQLQLIVDVGLVQSKHRYMTARFPNMFYVA